MALSTQGQGYYGTGSPTSIQAVRERNTVAALSGATGTVHLILEGGATLTGTVDVSGLGNPTAAASGNGGYGGTIKVTDAGTVVWLVPAGNVIAVGQ